MLCFDLIGPLMSAILDFFHFHMYKKYLVSFIAYILENIIINKRIVIVFCTLFEILFMFSSEDDLLDDDDMNVNVMGVSIVFIKYNVIIIMSNNNFQFGKLMLFYITL